MKKLSDNWSTYTRVTAARPSEPNETEKKVVFYHSPEADNRTWPCDVCTSVSETGKRTRVGRTCRRQSSGTIGLEMRYGRSFFARQRERELPGRGGTSTQRSLITWKLIPVGHILHALGRTLKPKRGPLLGNNYTAAQCARGNTPFPYFPSTNTFTYKINNIVI